MSLRIIDTHQHLWDPAVFRYSWMEALPAINRRAMIEEYREAALGLNIDQSVYVDTDVDDADMAGEIASIFRLADDPASGIGGIVAGAKLEKRDAFAHLQEWIGHPKLKGIRRVLHTQSDGVSAESQFLESMRELERHSWSFDLCLLPRQLSLGRELVEKFPQVSFVLDHCGVPDIRARALEPWSNDLHALALFPNVVCKVSGLVAYADPGDWSVADLKPFFEQALSAFGWERILWGGDWPVCTLAASLKEWVQSAMALTETATEEQRRKFFSENARRIYRLT